ncbi:MAG: hypothetical protein AAF560_22565 [Acidobacteriota bacterium]
MARNATFAEDLARLTERERAGLGKRPDPEALAALHDGALPEEEAERIREWLSVDPELAATYLELQRSPEPAAPAFDVDADAAWRELSARLDPPAKPDSTPASESPAAAPPAAAPPAAVPTAAVPSTDPTEYATVTPFTRRPVVRAALALAALALVALGLGWWQAQQDALPTGSYTRVAVTGEAYRGLTVTVPAGDVGIELAIELAASDSDGELDVMLVDANGRTIRAQTIAFAANQEGVVFRVAKADLMDGAAYELRYTPADGPDDAPFVFQVELVD